MNTPDTEWELVSEDKWHQTWRHKEHGQRQINTELLNFILTSHTTYWKERVGNLVREWVTHNAKTIQHNNGATEYIEVRELLTLLDNLK